MKIHLTCKTDTGITLETNTAYAVGCKLNFYLTSIGGVLNDIDKPQILWEVCNAGYGKDDIHHEIYYKDKNEDDKKCFFSRDLCFLGTHLLRCRVINKRKHFDQTLIFVVHGEN